MDDDLAFAGALEQRRRIARKGSVSTRTCGAVLRADRAPRRTTAFLSDRHAGGRAARGTGRRGCGDARRPAGASARRPGVDQGHGRHPRCADDEGLAHLSATTCRARTRSPWSGFSVPEPSCSARPTVRSSGSSATPPTVWGIPAEIPGIPIAAPAGRAAAARPRWPPGCARCRRAATAAARSAGPASFCGVYGIKATLGRVARHAGPGAPTPVNHFSQHGPLARTVRDAALMLQVLAGRDARDPNALPHPTRRLPRPPRSAASPG